MTEQAGYYRAHVFVCVNERPPGHKRGCCAGRGGTKIRDYMKARAKELGLEGVRVNAAGCLDRCEMGPVVVVYPEGIWYRCPTTEDADRILIEHLQGGRPVESLILGPDE